MVVRKYNIPDADMFQDSRTVRGIFITDKALFVARVPSFADPFADDWLSSIEASEAYESDEVRTDIQEQETADVLAKMAEARQVYNEAKMYIKLAFKDQPQQFKRFGLDDYEEAANSQPRMVVFLKNLHKQCQDSNAELIAKGWTIGAISNIATLATALATENTEQNVMISTSSQATEERIKQYNETFDFWHQVNEASKVVFYNDPVKLNQYLLPEGPQPDPDINLKGKVIDSISGAALKGVKVKVKELGIVYYTNYAGNFSFVSVPAGTYTLQVELAGYATQELPLTILASGVVVQNVSLVVN